MGAEFWEKFTPYRDKLETALEELQKSVLESGDYFKVESKKEKIKSLKKITQSFEDFCDNFPYELPEETLDRMFIGYQKQLKQLKNLPKAKTLKEKINEIMLLNEAEGTKSILDFDGFSETPEMCKITPLGRDKILELFGTEIPSRKDVADSNNKIAELCDRLIGVCVTVYESGKPTEIYFAGYSAD
ncbi:MAG: hypothetical protein GY702_28785 [Desulfobulbaceae bacterium]|nr:hypothetical protein [Desulfobulbaceae bacterium]